jgi:pimeloyl-ACP methyl ester carboxylesterase
MSSREFIGVMQRWRAFFTADKPVIGATEEELKTIQVPIAIIPGSDDIHPTAVGEELHRILPHSELFPPLWTPEERKSLQEQDPQRFRELGHERTAAIYLPFLAKLESARVSVP